MPLDMEVGLGPGDFVLDGNPAPLPNFRSMSIVDLWPNGWMDQYDIWYGGRPRPASDIVLDGDPAIPP